MLKSHLKEGSFVGTFAQQFDEKTKGNLSFFDGK